MISHTYLDGSEPFASHTLSGAERNYAQIEKEALSLIFRAQKFHQFLYCRRFELVTDHKPLTPLLGPKHGIPTLAAACLQRWALILSAYSYSIKFRSTCAHANADGLSRLSLGTQHAPALSCNYSFAVGQIQALPVTAEQVASATRTDVVLSKVYNYVTQGWPSIVEEETQPYWKWKEELSVEQGHCARETSWKGA